MVELEIFWVVDARGGLELEGCFGIGVCYRD